MRLNRLLFVLSLCCAATAAPVMYNVTIDTSSIAGTAGSLDFNFNPGPLVTQAASLQILNFTTNGLLTGSPSTIGDVGGTLPGTLTFDNATAFNDYFQGFTFGSALSFNVSVFGPALTSPDGTSTSGSSFAFSMFADAAGSIPTLTTDTVNGFAYVVDVKLDGTTTATSFLPGTSSPEPTTGSLVLFAIVLSGAMAAGRKRLS